MQDLIGRLQQVTELVGPNRYLQAAIIAVVFILLGKIASWLLSGMVGRIASKSTTNIDDQIVQLVHRPIFLSFVLAGLGIAATHIEMADTPASVTISILKTIVVVIWFLFARRLTLLLSATAARTSNSKLVQSGMHLLLENVVKIALIAFAIYFFFLAWGIEPTAWLASAGIIGLALSFAAKDSLSNLFAGVSIIADAPYKAGDFIILESGERGIVTHIGLRSTRILTRDDVEITIPNGIIGNSKIINEAGGPSEKHRMRIAVGVAYGSDIDKVIDVLMGVASEHNEICHDPEPRVRFRQFGDSSLDVELLCWIDRPVDRGRLNHELNCAVYKAFAAHDIQIPFPQRDLHVRSMPE